MKKFEESPASNPCAESSKTVFVVSIIKRQKNCIVLIYNDASD